MNILVTGSAGFVGQALVQRLKSAGHTVLGIDVRPDTLPDTFIQHDLTRPLPQPLSFELCIHLASSVGGFLFNTRQDLLSINDQINANTIDICRKAHCDRFMFFSSINVFEVCQTFAHGPLKSIDQKSAYAVSKANAEQLFQKHFKDCMVLRPTNLFGQSQKRNHQAVGESHVIPDLLEKMEHNASITVFGDGSQVRNFVHVSDVVDFVAQNLAFAGHHFFNLRSEITISIRELVDRLIQFKGKSIQPVYDPAHMRYELFAIQNFDLQIPMKYGWKPRIAGIQEGLSA